MAEKNKLRNEFRIERPPVSSVKPIRKATKNKLPTKRNIERPLKILGLFLLLFSLYLLLAFSSYFITWGTDQDVVQQISWKKIFQPNDFHVENWMGLVGALVAHQSIFNGFGLGAYVFIFVLFLLGFKLLFKESLFPMARSLAYSLFLLVFISVLTAFILHFFKGFPQFPSGVVGYQVNLWLNGNLGVVGTAGLLVFSALACLIAAFNVEFSHLVFTKKAPKEEKPRIVHPLEEEEGGGITISPSVPGSANTLILETNFNNDGEPAPSVVKSKPVEKAMPVARPNAVVKEVPELKVEQTETEKLAEGLVTQFGQFDPTLDLSSYQFPHLDLLENYGNNKVQINAAELEANKNKIVQTLGHYDIEIEKIKATIGPTVTLYEIIPKAGVRISKIKNLEDDIALNLAALGIRIIAPIPGKGTIGIEVPNQQPELVSMRSVLATEKYQKTDMELPIALGKTISNEVFIADLTKMPHLLMAGATGQGKSVGINALLVSLLYKKHPSQLKFVLVDPKKVELTLFRKIERHFLAKLPGEEEAIITDTKKVIYTLNSLCMEMDQRYDLLKDGQVRNLKEYNQKFVHRKLNPEEGHRYLPFIVLIIDEFADLMMTAGKEVETPIARLAQLARAVGIHLVIATQRPSVNIITGTIKANFPARLAFRVTSKIDSRTILDSGGADQLIGRGDMLLSTGSDIIRLQCAFVDTPEVERITDFIGSQRGYASAMYLPEYVGEEGEAMKEIDLENRDPLFEEAAHLIVLHQQGSTSLIQRKLKLGYNRAGRIIDELEAAKIVGPFEGSKARQVLFPDEHSLNQHLHVINANS